MYHCQYGEHHTLVTGSQVIEKLLHFLFLLFHIIGNGCGEVVVSVLSALPIRNVGFNAEQTAFRFSHGFISRNRDNVDRQHQIAVKLRNLGNHTVLDIGRILTHKKHSAVSVANLEIVLFKLHRIGTDIVLEAVTFLAVFLDVKVIAAFLTDTVEVVENTQAFCGVKLRTPAAELTQMGNHIITDTAEISAGVLDILLADGYRDVFVLHHRICARRFFEEHLVVLLAVLVKVIALERNQD